ncbi:MAG: choice-of-anchor J domain-containing protein [Bacteroidales bacterium]|nr:choice-of-anchor J domain-containing protein [Bacteroidales bacterium]
MRRLLLIFLSVMAFAGTSVAQDVYSGGYYVSSSVQQAAVYKNGTKLYNTSFSGNYYGDCTGVYADDNDVYWVRNAYYNDEFYYGDVMKNNNAYLNSPTGEGRHIYGLKKNAYGLYAVGCMDINGVRTAVVWKNNDTNVHRQMGDGIYESVAYDTKLGLDDFLYSCGYQHSNSSTYHGVIWKGNAVLHAFDNGTKLYGIDYYEGYFYTVGLSVESGVNKLKVWQTDASTGWTSVPYTISSSLSPSFIDERFSIHVDAAGDIYVNGMDGSVDKIWKNGGVLYFANITYGYAVSVNSNGVYYCGESDGGKIWKDGSVLYSPSDCNGMTCLYINEPECTESDILALPFTDGFENGNTSWPCWTKLDVDNSNGTNISYWNRCGKRIQPGIATGNYCAAHRFGPGGNAQEGWLISPRLFLQPGRDNTTLTFKTCEGYPTSLEYEGVWVSTNSNPTTTSAYTQVWTQTNASDSWKNVTIDLSAYQGQAIYIGFKYTGTFAHSWYIDDVSVTESWSPCGTYSVPFVMTFDDSEEPGYCWYIDDHDHTGDNRCWKYNESEHCVYHPYGQSGQAQMGFLCTPKIQLPAGHDYVLKFKSKNSSSGSGMQNMIWLKQNETGVPNPGSYTTQIWNDTQFPTSWTEVEVPLTAYAGSTITLNFAYYGTYAHNWYIDDVRVEEAVAQYTITVNANNNAWGTVSGGGTYNAGETCTLHATPASGYQFESWKKNGTVVSTNPNYSFTVTESATYTAYFSETPVTYYTITTNVTPAGSGTVTGAGTYQEGSTVTLTATPNNGYTFSQWQDGNTQNPRTITVTQNATYTATFVQDNYVITVNASPANGGTVSGGGAYHYGETATLAATANSGYEFQGWQDGNIDNPRSITVTGNATYTAIFGEVGTTYYTITTNVSPAGAGTVTGGGTYEEGSVVTLTATANPGYTFDHWNDGVTQNPRTVTVTSSMSFTAIFTQNMYTITVVANPSNGGTVTGGGSYAYGSYATLIATPYSGFDFAGWSDGSSENPHQVLVTGNATYTATFSQGGATYYTVSAYVSPAGSGTVTGTGTYQAGATCTLTAIANSGYTFDHWNDGNTQNPRTVTVNNNMSFTAYFTSSQYTITVNANPSAGGTVTGGGTYAYGATVVLTATPNSGYEFLQWSDGVSISTRIITVTGNATYTALFSNGSSQFYTLTVTSNSPFLGETSGSGTYPAGSEVEISAYPSVYAHFIKWNDGNTENPRNVVVNSDMEFVAEFGTAEQYTIEVVSANEAMGQAFGGGTFTEGDVIEISAVAYTGYVFTGWQDGNTDNPRSITVTGNATYTAQFAENSVTTYTVTLICNTSEGTVSGGGVYVAGTVAYVQAFPNDGYDFDKWNDGSTDNPREITVNSDMTLVAFFKGTGIEEEEMNPMAVYPNPAKETIRLVGIEANSTVQIYNSLGELVKTVSTGPDQEIGVRDLASGLYLVRCGNRTLRFVKEL